MTGSIDYGNLMYAAMRSLIQNVLKQVAEGGLPGSHHFLITFDTMTPRRGDRRLAVGTATPTR